MDLEEALNVEPGDKLIFEPSNFQEFPTISSIDGKSIIDLYPDQPVVVTSVVGYKEKPFLDSTKKDLFLLGQLFYKNDRFKDESHIDQIYFEIEDSMNLLPMQLFNTPTYALLNGQLVSEFQSLEEVLEVIVAGDFVLCDYMDDLVDENIYDVNFKHYIDYLNFAVDLVGPVSREELERDKELTLSILEKQIEDGEASEEDLENVEDIDLEQAYLLQKELNYAQQHFYKKSAEFCEAILHMKPEIKTYADFVQILTTGQIKNNILDFFLKEEYLLKKEFLRFVSTGYHYNK